MILYLIRHAWADHDDTSAWSDDRLRPLSEQGKSRFAAMVRLLVQRGFDPQLIATSPLVRCRQTAELAAAGARSEPEVVSREELAPGSDLGAILRWTVKRADRLEQVAWVGHAPDVGHMTAWLTGGQAGGIDFAKGAVAAVRFDGPLDVGAGTLRWMVTAKVLGCY